MKYKIVYDSPGRIRLRCGFGAFERDCEDSLTSLLTGISGVTSANVSYENVGMLIYYTGDAREEILDAVSSLKASELTPQPPDSMQIIDDEFTKRFFRHSAPKNTFKAVSAAGFKASADGVARGSVC